MLLRGPDRPEGCVVVEANHEHNPFFPPDLRADMERDYRIDPENAKHVWGGDYHHHNSGRVEDGHPNVAGWAMALEAMTGMQIRGHGNTTLMDTSSRGYIYGYPPHLDPRPAAVARRAAFRRLAGIDQEEGNG
jgi:hypothetical protein